MGRGVPEPCGCGTEGRSQWLWGGWTGVGLGDLSALSNINDSKILWSFLAEQ